MPACLQRSGLTRSRSSRCCPPICVPVALAHEKRAWLTTRPSIMTSSIDPATDVATATGALAATEATAVAVGATTFAAAGGCSDWCLLQAHSERMAKVKVSAEDRLMDHS